ncbi:tetratricopeptide repeat protein [Candidatus Sumerlaeota bacterium]|nr:tetratricopeptide repeat protein [Candidatus Sumerlaeota bacterium]
MISQALDRWSKYIFLALAFLTPMLFDSASYDSFITPKTLWIECCILLLALLTVARVALNGEFKLKPGWPNGALLLYLCWSIASVIWAESRSLAWDAAKEALYLLLFCALLQDWLAARRTHAVMLAYAVIPAATLSACCVLAQDFGHVFFPHGLPQFLQVSFARLPDWRGQLNFGFGNTSHIADFQALTFLPALMLYLIVRRKALRGYLLVHLWLSAAAMIVCWSVHTDAGLILGALTLLSAWIRRKGALSLKRIRGRLILLCAGFAAVILFYFLPSPMNPHSAPAHPGIWQQAFGSERWQEGGATRLIIWGNSWESAKARWLLGAGAGNFTYVYPQRHSPRAETDPMWRRYAGSWTNAAHNELLEAWVETGLIGAALLLVLAAAVIVRLLRRMRTANEAEWRIAAVTLSIFVAFCVFSMMNFPLQLPFTQLVFMALLSIAAALPEKSARQFPLDVTLISQGPLLLKIRTLKMRRIGAVTLRGNFPAWGAALLIAAIIVLCARPLMHNYRALQAERAFKYAYEYSARQQTLEAVRAAETALQWDPDHIDARSMLTEKLIQAGAYQEALKQLSILERRFQANELWSRYYWAYRATGQDEKARAALRQIFQRVPRSRDEAPELQRWLEQSSTQSHNSM